jgi:hypothetical protein
MRRRCEISSHNVFYKGWCHMFFTSKDGKPYALIEGDGGTVNNVDLTYHTVKFIDTIEKEG